MQIPMGPMSPVSLFEFFESLLQHGPFVAVVAEEQDLEAKHQGEKLLQVVSANMPTTKRSDRQTSVKTC